MLPQTIKRYLANQAYQPPLPSGGCEENDFAGAVVIPSLAESTNLFATLRSLARNPHEILSRFLVVVVVNHRQDAPEEDKTDNFTTLAMLREDTEFTGRLNLAWVDAASPGHEMPTKGGGVGLARKIGLDFALTRLDHTCNDPFLVCLDADTLVEPQYLSALVCHFKNTASGSAVIPFRHQQETSSEAQSAITRYELFLRCYVLGLKQANSPYGFHTVGSAMACKASAYVKIGGMNNRAAGEDFYFLQQLARTVGVEQVKGTVVFPSSRSSHRVPFGTGRSVSRLLGGDKQAVLFYRTQCFGILAQWLALVSAYSELSGQELHCRAHKISPHLAEYLQSLSFPDVWEKLRRNHPTPKALATAFHGWFDGLKTMKLIHHLSAGPFPRCEPDHAVPGLFEWAGLEKAVGANQQLELLRREQS